MPSSESELTGKTLGPQPAKVAPAAAAAGGAKKHKKGDKSGKDAAAAEVVPEESKCLSLHWQKRTFSEAWLATLQLPLNKVRFQASSAATLC